MKQEFELLSTKNRDRSHYTKNPHITAIAVKRTESIYTPNFQNSIHTHVCDRSLVYVYVIVLK